MNAEELPLKESCVEEDIDWAQTATITNSDFFEHFWSNFTFYAEDDNSPYSMNNQAAQSLETAVDFIVTKNISDCVVKVSSYIQSYPSQRSTDETLMEAFVKNLWKLHKSFPQLVSEKEVSAFESGVAL